jgi:hypothetical protein
MARPLGLVGSEYEGTELTDMALRGEGVIPSISPRPMKLWTTGDFAVDRKAGSPPLVGATQWIWSCPSWRILGARTQTQRLVMPRR